MERHHGPCQRRFFGDTLRLKPPTGYLCRMHEPPIDCEKWESLRIHLYLFHRAQHDTYLYRHHFKQANIERLPMSILITITSFEREVKRMEAHANSHGDPLHLDDFHLNYNRSLQEEVQENQMRTFSQSQKYIKDLLTTMTTRMKIMTSTGPVTIDISDLIY
jgi:hypothetical protein